MVHCWGVRRCRLAALQLTCMDSVRCGPLSAQYFPMQAYIHVCMFAPFSCESTVTVAKPPFHHSYHRIIPRGTSQSIIAFLNAFSVQWMCALTGVLVGMHFSLPP